MKIQTRDLDVFQSCKKYGLLSTNQIAMLHFKNLHPTTLMRRLKILEKAKYINRIDSLPNNQSAWSLGMEGARYLRADPPGRFTNRNTTLHDVTLSGVRMALERRGLGENFSSEMELKKRINRKLNENEKSRLQVPDGIFTAQAPVTKTPIVVALEVELTPKNHQRYRKIIEQYLAKTSLTYVWYVMKSEGIAQTIVDQYRKLPRYENSPKFVFSYVHQAEEGSNELPVYDGKAGKWMKLTDIFDLPGLSEKDGPQACNPEGRQNEAGLGREAA